MTLGPLVHASLPIQIHVATVVPAALLGAWLLAGPKGTPGHRLAGRIWMGLMVASAISSFFIHTLRMVGPFSPIHLLSLFVILGAVNAIRTARQGNIAAHRRTVQGMYLGGIVGAGLFTLLPGRIMHAVLLGGNSGIAFAAAAVFGAVLLAALAARQKIAARQM